MAPVKSMTGFASGTGAAPGWVWSWDIRAVNGRGLDMRLRLPDWVEGLEPALREAVKPVVVRGSMNIGLRLHSDGTSGATRIDEKVLDAILGQVRQIEDRALGEHDLELSPTSAADILGMRALSESGADKRDTRNLRGALVDDFSRLLSAFDEMRTREGRELARVIGGQLDDLEALIAEAQDAARQQTENAPAVLRASLARVLDNADGVDPQRLAQELALIAVKSDVTEEIDRLKAHVDAARELLKKGGAVGRKFDFLTQEFNREANTLCSKAQSGKLTRVGLDLKAVIDRMREQVQNVE